MWEGSYNNKPEGVTTGNEMLFSGGFHAPSNAGGPLDGSFDMLLLSDIGYSVYTEGGDGANTGTLQSYKTYAYFSLPFNFSKYNTSRLDVSLSDSGSVSVEIGIGTYPFYFSDPDFDYDTVYLPVLLSGHQYTITLYGTFSGTLTFDGASYAVESGYCSFVYSPASNISVADLDVSISGSSAGYLQSFSFSENSNDSSGVEQAIRDQTQQQADQYEDFTTGGSGDDPAADLEGEFSDSIGLFDLIEQTASGILDVFTNTSSVGSVITFPGFSLDVGGQSYQIWADQQVDLSQYEDSLGVLLTAVRFATVATVYGALLWYLQKFVEGITNGNDN